MISTYQLIDELDCVHPKGLQICHGVGIMTSTKAIYIYKSLIYIFRIEDAFLFEPLNGYTKEEFTSEYSNTIWAIEEVIS